MADPKPRIDPRDLAPLGLGFGYGVAIMAFLVLVGLLFGLSPALSFGIPYQ
jgi:hypothetical protein